MSLRWRYLQLQRNRNLRRLQICGRFWPPLPELARCGWISLALPAESGLTGLLLQNDRRPARVESRTHALCSAPASDGFVALIGPASTVKLSVLPKLRTRERILVCRRQDRDSNGRKLWFEFSSLTRFLIQPNSAGFAAVFQSKFSPIPASHSHPSAVQ